MIESENAEKSESQKHEKGVSQFTNNKTNQTAVITNFDSKVHLSIYVVDCYTLNDHWVTVTK